MALDLARGVFLLNYVFFFQIVDYYHRLALDQLNPLTSHRWIVKTVSQNVSGSCFRSVTETWAETKPPKWKTFEKRLWPVCGFAHVWPKRTETLRNSEVFIWLMGFHLCWVANFQTRLLRTIRTRSSEMTVCTWKISSCPEVVEFDTDGDTCVQAILDLKWQGYRSLKVDAQAVILFNRSYL